MSRRPSPRDLLSDELDKISSRIRHTTADGRDAFFDGSASYDHAVVAIVRLAALFEDGARYGELLSAATPRERIGIAHTRNIAAHRGYAAMDDELFWQTVTVDMPAFIAKLRDENGL
ncbi:antitoxin [Microbacterium sp. KUDC0406]|uniref:antitoxin n=1 Tax=Microbacterium sp. KUDC0406 TaxID=2909588 RepID=UPI001F379D99|nr:antitoxin [Microbacterium sp. KUDC0406]UJP09228.1 antitoxin [Microbacterium sp. KUDC0406]